MRRLLLAVFAVVCMALPSSAFAQGAGDSVWGEAADPDGDVPRVISVFASSDPDGGNPTGELQLRSQNAGSTRVSVTCLNVRGREAILGFTGQDFDPDLRPIAGYARILDRVVEIAETALGPSWVPTPEAPQPPPPLPGPTTCASFPPFPRLSLLTLTFEVGNIVVTDAPSFPTSKEQCNNGGWRNFGATFKNQGQCVAFIQRGPKA